MADVWSSVAIVWYLIEICLVGGCWCLFICGYCLISYWDMFGKLLLMSVYMLAKYLTEIFLVWCGWCLFIWCYWLFICWSWVMSDYMLLYVWSSVAIACYLIEICLVWCCLCLFICGHCLISYWDCLVSCGWCLFICSYCLIFYRDMSGMVWLLSVFLWLLLYICLRYVW